MKARRGYLNQKGQSNIGRWLKRYFAKRTCRPLDYQEEIEVQDVIGKVVAEGDLVVVIRKGSPAVGVYCGYGLVVFESGRRGKYKNIYKIENPTDDELELEKDILEANGFPEPTY